MARWSLKVKVTLSDHRPGQGLLTQLSTAVSEMHGLSTSWHRDVSGQTSCAAEGSSPTESRTPGRGSQVLLVFALKTALTA